MLGNYRAEIFIRRVYSKDQCPLFNRNRRARTILFFKRR